MSGMYILRNSKAKGCLVVSLKVSDDLCAIMVRDVRSQGSLCG